MIIGIILENTTKSQIKPYNPTKLCSTLYLHPTPLTSLVSLYAPLRCRACSLCSRIRHDNYIATRRRLQSTSSSICSPRWSSAEPSHASRAEHASISSQTLPHLAERGSFGTIGPTFFDAYQGPARAPTRYGELSLRGTRNIADHIRRHQQRRDDFDFACEERDDHGPREELLDFEKASRITTAGTRSRASTKRCDTSRYTDKIVFY